MLTCKQFLRELNDYLEETLDPAQREVLQKHVNECPSCWVVCDTTLKTIKVYKGMEAHAVPPEMQDRLMAAIQKKMEVEGPCCGHKEASNKMEPTSEHIKS